MTFLTTLFKSDTPRYFHACRRGKRRIDLSVLGLFCMSLFASPAVAIIEVGDGAPETGTTVNPGEAVAITFILDEDVTDAQLDIEAFCPTCIGAVWLNEGNFGPTSLISDTIYSAALDFNSPLAPVVEGLDLDAGTYHFIVSISSGFFSWGAYTFPVPLVIDPVAEIDFDAFASPTAPWAPQSFFVATPGTQLGYTLTGTIVPEPSAALMLGVGVVALVGARKRRCRPRPTETDSN